MNRVFADTSYWIALLDPRDELHSKATAVTKELGAVRILTTEMVLVELLNSFRAGGPAVRTAAAGAVEQLRRNPGMIVTPQTSEQFDSAISKLGTRSGASPIAPASRSWRARAFSRRSLTIATLCRPDTRPCCADSWEGGILNTLADRAGV